MRFWFSVLSIAIVVQGMTGCLAQASGPFDFEFQQLADGVYVAIRPESIRAPVEGNATILINDRDVVVCEGGGMPLAAENVIAKIRELTDKPVRYVINSHWHGDHHLGNQAYKEAYPGVEFISHAFTREDIVGPPMDYMDQMVKDLPQQMEGLKAQLEGGTMQDGSPIPDEARRWYQQMVDGYPVLLEDVERLESTPPSLTFEDKLTLHRGERIIEILYLGRGNTRGDAVVHLPNEKIVITGDLVVLPTPYGFGTYPSDWIETLGKIQELDFEQLVPGHGPVQTGGAYLETLQALFASVLQQTQEIVADGGDLERLRAEVEVTEFADQLCGDSELLKSLFKNWFVTPFTLSTYKEAIGEPIIQGQEE